MTFLVVVLGLGNHVCLDSHLLCYKKAHIQTDEELWKRIAAMSILLAVKKLEDNISDDNDLKAKIGLHIFQSAAKKAEADYPLAAEIFAQGFKEMSSMEKERKDVYALSQKFGDILTEAISVLFSFTSQDKIIMRHVTQWIYFIDALDDLDDDVRDGNYNPFKALATSRKALISGYSVYLEQFISTQMMNISTVLSSYSEGTHRNWIIISILTDTIPTITERVLKGEKPYKRIPVLAQSLQRRGGYKLA